MIKICPECGGIATYNPYFHAHICSSPKCPWMEEPKWEDEKKKPLYRISKRLAKELPEQLLCR